MTKIENFREAYDGGSTIHILHWTFPKDKSKRDGRGICLVEVRNGTYRVILSCAGGNQ